MIRFSNGYETEFFAASGALEYDGYGWPWEQPLRWVGLFDPKLFTIVGKTVTRHPRQGNLRWYNPFRAVRFIKDGTVNAVGLTNPGIEVWMRKYEPRVVTSGFSFFLSIGPADAIEFLEMLEILEDARILGIEFNPLCPNTDSVFYREPRSIVNCCRIYQQWNLGRIRKGKSSLPLILKLEISSDYKYLAQATEGLVEAISFNSVPWHVAFPDRSSPLVRFGGGAVSGKAAQTFLWRMHDEVRAITRTPLILPSIWEYADILQRPDADAYSFGAVFLCYPWRPTCIVRQWQKEKTKEVRG